LITGAAGLLGANLIEYFACKTKYEICAVTHSNKFQTNHKVVEFIGDLEDIKFCEYVTKDIDWVFHCAAKSYGVAGQKKNIHSLVIPNVRMNVNLIEASFNNKVTKFIYPSSMTAYPDTTEAVTEDMFFQGDPFEGYFGIGWVKRYTEKLGEYYTKHGMQCIMPRMSNMVGPYDNFSPEKSHVFPSYIRKFVEQQETMEVYGNGMDTRDFLYINDAIEGIISCVLCDKYKDNINLAYGMSFSVVEIIASLSKYTGHYPRLKFISDGPRGIGCRRVNNKLAFNKLGWYPRISFDKAIELTYDWYENSRNVLGAANAI